MEHLIDPTNYKLYIDKLLALETRGEFIRTLEAILVKNYSLWFTEIGDIYLKNHGVDCRLPAYKPQRTKDHNYVVVIYNRYQ